MKSQNIYAIDIITSLRLKCPYSEFFWSAFTCIQTLFTQCFLEMRNLEMSLTRHTKITEDYEGLAKMQNRDWSYFMEKVIAVVKSLNKRDLSEKETKILKERTKKLSNLQANL